MGYTHYWRIDYTKAPADAYGRFALDTKRICEWAEEHGIPLGGKAKRGPGDKYLGEERGADIAEGELYVNGMDDDAHETFYWQGRFDDNDEWNVKLGYTAEANFAFCKTARKPYDIVVCAALIRAKKHYGDAVSISSDGYWDADDEWVPARKLVAELFDDDPVNVIEEG